MFVFVFAVAGARGLNVVRVTFVVGADFAADLITFLASCKVLAQVGAAAVAGATVIAVLAESLLAGTAVELASCSS